MQIALHEITIVMGDLNSKVGKVSGRKIVDKFELATRNGRR